MLLGTVVAACGNNKVESSDDNKKEFTIGFGPSTYEDQFRYGILPILEEKGYKVNIKTFTQNMQINPAMGEGSLDASVFQSTAYMEGINEQLDLNMTEIAFAPSAPQGLYSVNHKSLDEVKDGATVAFPNDPVNQERAARILEELGWVTVDKDAGTTDFNISSIKSGDYNIDIKVLDPPQILVSLQDVDYGVVNGNYISAANQKISDALKIENTPKEHRVIVSINEASINAGWAKDLKEAYESEAFEDYILAQENYEGFILPEIWESN